MSEARLYVGGGTAGSAYLGCSTCGQEYMDNAGEWGGPDKPELTLKDLVAAVEAHVCSDRSAGPAGP